MSELQDQIQAQLDAALPTTIIQLPNELLDFPLTISKTCTIIGAENTIIDVSSLDEDYAVKIEADNVVFSDIKNIKNKTETNHHGIYIKSVTNVSIERLSVSCDVGILAENCIELDLVEVKAMEATTGFFVKDCRNININGCEAENCQVGLDIIGSSSVIGDVDTYQFLGLNIIATEISSLTNGTIYSLEIDGMIYSFTATLNMTYQDIIDAINSIHDFQPIYKAEIVNNDIKISSQNTTLSITNTTMGNDLISSLNITLNTPNNHIIVSTQALGLNVAASASAPLIDGTIYSFDIDGVMFNFAATANMTFQDVVDSMNRSITNLNIPSPPFIIFNNNDILFKNHEVSITLTEGSSYTDLLKILLDVTTIELPAVANNVITSEQGFGLAVSATDNSPLTDTTYLFEVDGTSYSFNGFVNMTYQDIVDTINLIPNFIYKAEFINGDIKLIINAPAISIEPSSVGIDLLVTLPTNLKVAVEGSADLRLDRAHHINVMNTLLHHNVFGARIINGNDIAFNNSKIFFNSNIGIWQLPGSYNNVFRGEIYSNINYGIRNTDKVDGPHIFDAMESWWGDITGPSQFGTGEGDKISAGVLYKPVRQSGTVPDLNYPKTRRFILSALGYPIVKVELTDEQIMEAIDKAIYKYMQYRTPEPTQRYITASAGSNMIQLPLDIPKEDIIEVTYSPNADIFAQLSGSGESFLMTYYMQGTAGTFLADFFIAMSYRETMEQTLGIMPTYELLSGLDLDGSGEYRDFIRLAPRPSGNLSIGLLVSRPMTEEETDNVAWIHRYALARSKEILGRIRSKYGSVPGPTGEMQLDGPTLLSEASIEIEKLEEMVILMGQPLGFMAG